MKNTRLNRNPLFLRWPLAALALKFGLAAGIVVSPLHADDDNAVPSGYNEDEWYDPGDWFDGNNIESAGSDWWDTNTGWNDNHQHAYIYTTRPYYYYYWDPVLYSWSTITTDDNASNPESQKDSKGKSGKANPIVFEGKVDGFKKVDILSNAKKSDRSTFVRIRLKDGGVRVVSLGSETDLASLNLDKGDDIRVSGYNCKVDGRTVLSADQIQVDGASHRISQPGGKRASIEGVVRQSTKTKIRGAKEKNLLVRLELENGKSCIVDLGKGTSLADLDIESGSRIRLEGEKIQVEGKSLIVAHKLRVDGDSTQIRSEDTDSRRTASQTRRDDSSATTSSDTDDQDSMTESASNEDNME